MSSHPRASRRSSLAQRAVQFSVALCLGVGLVGVVSVPAYAVDYTVTTDAELRAAITNAANSDTITFGGAFAVLGGDLPVLDNAVTINGNGYALLLNGTASLRIENTDVTINNLYVSGGSTANLEFVNAGGAINSVTLSGSGGVGLSFSSLIMERHLAVSNSSVNINAGAGYSITHGNASTVNVQGGTVTGNGVGILANLSQAGALTLNGTSISNNTNEGVHITNLTDGAVLSLDSVVVGLNGSEGLRFSSALGTSNTTITNSTIVGNPGGGMEFTQLINGARVSVSGTNILASAGPGIYLETFGEGAAFTLTDSVVSGNSTGISVYAGSGSAVLTLERSNIANNGLEGIVAVSLLNSARIDVTDSTLVANPSAGISIQYASNSAALDVNRSTIAGNGPHAILALVDQGATVALENTTVSGHTSGQLESTIIIDSGANPGGQVSIQNSTITANSNTNALRLSNTGSTLLSHTIVSGNTVTNDVLIESGTLATVEWSLIGTLTDVDGLSSIQPNSTLGVSDPGLEALADNDGPTLTHALLGTSPARDAGNPAFGTDPSIDQRGEARIQNGRIDIGAYEYEPQLASTGNEPVPLLIGGGALALVGLLLLVQSRRHRLHRATE